MTRLGLSAEGLGGVVLSLAICVAGCEETPRDTACRTMPAGERVSFAQKALHKELEKFASGTGVATMSDRGHVAYPSDFTNVRAEELRFERRDPVEGDLQMEMFEFRTARAPGFRWMITLYDTALSGYDACPTTFGLVWSGENK